MDKLLIVDGSNLLFQMFYGMPARIINHEGKAIQGTLGFVGALLKIIRMTAPTHIFVAFDGECENPRTLLDAEYKGNRPDYMSSAKPDVANELYEYFKALVSQEVKHVGCGEFGADMEVTIVNDGPVTIVMDSRLLHKKG